MPGYLPGPGPITIVIVPGTGGQEVPAPALVAGAWQAAVSPDREGRSAFPAAGSDLAPAWRPVRADDVDVVGCALRPLPVGPDPGWRARARGGREALRGPGRAGGTGSWPASIPRMRPAPATVEKRREAMTVIAPASRAAVRRLVQPGQQLDQR